MKFLNHYMFLSDCSNPTLYHNFLKPHMIKSIVSSHGSAWVLFSFHIDNLEFSENCLAIMWFGIFLKLSTICAWNISKFSPSQMFLNWFMLNQRRVGFLFQLFWYWKLSKKKRKIPKFSSLFFEKKDEKFPQKKALNKNVIYLLQR